MSELVDVLRSFWFTPVVNVEGFRREKISDWLASGDYQCVGGSSGGNLDFVWFNQNSIVSSYAGDADRFACAALESFIFAYCSQGRGATDGISWKYISLYYAAYFAVISLLKCCGRSVSFVDGQELRSLQQVVHQSWPHVGSPPSPKPGVYELIVDQKAQILRLRKSKASRAHSALWKCFAHLSDDLETQINTLGGAAVLPVASDQLRRLRFHLGIGSQLASNGDVLSSIRNAINYRQEYGVWFPYSGSGVLSKIDKRDISGTMSDCGSVALPETSVNKDRAFCDVAKFLVSVCFENAHELAFRGKGAKSFIKKGCLRFAAEHELA